MSDDLSLTQDQSPREAVAWKEIVVQYQKPSTWRALWQIVNTIGSYLMVWYLIYCSLAVSWWIAIQLAIIEGALLMRMFIIHNDCGHGSFFKSCRAYIILGFLSCVLTLFTY